MAMLENPMTFVRSLKGAPASVLCALLLVRGPMTNRQLQLWTGYGDEAITIATHLLVEMGWVTGRSSHGPWALADGRQMPLMASLPDSGISGSLSSSSSFLNSESEEKIEQEEQEVPDFPEVRSCLLAAGVREPKASRLASLPHVTPEFIQAHVEQARKQGHPLGTAIYRIENGWEVELPEGDNPNRKYIEGEYAEFIEH